MAHYSDRRLVKPEDLRRLVSQVEEARGKFVETRDAVNHALSNYFGRDSVARAAYFGPLMKALAKKESDREISGEKKAKRRPRAESSARVENETKERLRVPLWKIAGARSAAAQRRDDPDFEGEEDSPKDREVVEEYLKELENLPPNGRR